MVIELSGHRGACAVRIDFGPESTNAIRIITENCMAHAKPGYLPRTLLLLLALLPAALQAQPQDARTANVALINEQLAHHVGVLAYLWGYPMVDMSTQMHNETHRVAPQQQVLAPLNYFNRMEYLVTPTSSGGLRAPNNDTLYLSGWFDLSQEPVIVRTPDTGGRYYTLAVTDFFNEVTHIGRRTTGTAENYFALVGPDFKGELPDGVTAVPVATRQAWILGRVLVDGEADFAQALQVMRGFWSAPLSQWKRGQPARLPPVEDAAKVDPRGSLEYFAVLNRWLRSNRVPADEGALMAQFDRIGFGPGVEFDESRIDAATRNGLLRAIEDGRALLRAASQTPMPDVRNGWTFPLGLADYGHDYLMRANVAFGGYANRPEESAYAARTVDDAGQLMSGANNYRLHFKPEQIPPAGAFWSIIAYDLQTLSLIANPIERYSIGDRTPGLQFNADGTLDIYIQKDEPAQGRSNWLPVGEGPFMMVVRIYEPGPGVFDGSYAPPPLQMP